MRFWYQSCINTRINICLLFIAFKLLWRFVSQINHSTFTPAFELWSSWFWWLQRIPIFIIYLLYFKRILNFILLYFVTIEHTFISGLLIIHLKTQIFSLFIPCKPSIFLLGRFWSDLSFWFSQVYILAFIRIVVLCLTLPWSFSLFNEGYSFLV